MQKKLRKELLENFPATDPDWDQINSANTLPYLDAIVHETLRFYPAVPDTIRVVSSAPVPSPCRSFYSVHVHS
jgi:cytochrome P450